MEYRHELKFKLTNAQMYAIEKRIQSFLKIDPHQKGDYYTITSVYFDDVHNSCLKENIEGYDLRSKYRIRVYNHLFEYIKLEKKEKIHGMTKKTTVKITKEEAEQIINNLNYSIAIDSEDKKRILTEMKVKGLKPISVVEYDRSVYIYNICNVRITFDKNIRATSKIKSFWEDDTHCSPKLPQNLHVLEVKYDEFLPEFIYTILDLGFLQKSGFSKYASSRIY